MFYNVQYTVIVAYIARIKYDVKDLKYLNYLKKKYFKNGRVAATTFKIFINKDIL